MYQRVFFGKVTNEKNRSLPDCKSREKVILAVITAVIVAMGIYPRPFLRRMDTTVAQVIQRVEQSRLSALTSAPAARGELTR